MRQLLLCIPCILLTLQASQARPSAYPEKHACTLDPTHMIHLARDGKPTCEIVIGKYPYPIATFAAQELQTFLGRVIGEGRSWTLDPLDRQSYGMHQR